MSSSLWQKQGQSLSHNNACKEFGLTEQEIFTAMREGKLQYQQSYAHGNPYYKLLRVEVKALVLSLRGSNYTEEQKIDHELKIVTREINSLKRKLTALGKKKSELIEAQNKLKNQD